MFFHQKYCKNSSSYQIIMGCVWKLTLSATLSCQNDLYANNGFWIFMPKDRQLHNRNVLAKKLCYNIGNLRKVPRAGRFMKIEINLVHTTCFPPVKLLLRNSNPSRRSLEKRICYSRPSQLDYFSGWDKKRNGKTPKKGV